MMIRIVLVNRNTTNNHINDSNDYINNDNGNSNYIVLIEIIKFMIISL